MNSGRWLVSALGPSLLPPPRPPVVPSLPAIAHRASPTPPQPPCLLLPPIIVCCSAPCGETLSEWILFSASSSEGDSSALGRWSSVSPALSFAKVVCGGRSWGGCSARRDGKEPMEVSRSQPQSPPPCLVARHQGKAPLEAPSVQPPHSLGQSHGHRVGTSWLTQGRSRKLRKCTSRKRKMASRSFLDSGAGSA
jgi:hypothetical protein